MTDTKAETSTVSSTLHEDTAEILQRRQAAKAALLRQQVRAESPARQAMSWAITPLKQANGLVREKVHFGPRRRRIIADYLKQDGLKGLHIGCGPHRKDGWLNTDVLPMRLPWTAPDAAEKAWDFPLDITRDLPFPDNSLDVIFGEEVIEHIERYQAHRFFVEARRALKEGGVLKMTTPDLEGICRTFLGIDEDIDLGLMEPYWMEAEWSREIWINAMFRYWGHRFIWNFTVMEHALKEAGFTRVFRVEKHETKTHLDVLAEVEVRPFPPDDAARVSAACSLVVEAVV